MFKRLSILLIMSWIFSINNVYAGSIKEEYELQERCGKNAAESFNRLYGKVKLTTHFTNHYNKKLNKCFILVTDIYLPKDKKERPLLTKVLYDVNENKEYASITILTDTNELMECTVLGKPCFSKSEWDAIVKPFMEE